MPCNQSDYNKMERKRKKAERRHRRAREKRLKKEDKMYRAEANESHKTYQSRLETSDDGWMRQSLVNKVLGMFGDR